MRGTWEPAYKQKQNRFNHKGHKGAPREGNGKIFFRREFTRMTGDRPQATGHRLQVTGHRLQENPEFSVLSAWFLLLLLPLLFSQRAFLRVSPRLRVSVVIFGFWFWLRYPLSLWWIFISHQRRKLLQCRLDPLRIFQHAF